MISLGGRPLLDNRIDAELFVDREQELRLLFSALEHQHNALVTGEPGIGKTSLLRALMYRARNQNAGSTGGYAITYVRAEGISDGNELLTRIAGEVLGEDTQPHSGGSDEILKLLEEDRHHVVARRQAESKPDGVDVTSVIIVDDVTASAGHSLFGRLRDELWELGYTWVIAARTSERGGLFLPPADAFFEREIEVGPLQEKAATELISKRTGSPAGHWPEQVAQAVGGNPRRILAVARDLIEEQGSFETVLAAITQQDAAIRALGRSETMLANELDSLGAAAASDDALLSRLGWTRSRAVQVLGRLEKAGLVRSDDVRIGQGRPRKVFRLTPPADYVAHLQEQREFA